jgi:hypothetical protein
MIAIFGAALTLIIYTRGLANIMQMIGKSEAAVEKDESSRNRLIDRGN